MRIPVSFSEGNGMLARKHFATVEEIPSFKKNDDLVLFS
jgi:hypothetical protein